MGTRRFLNNPYQACSVVKDWKAKQFKSLWKEEDKGLKHKGQNRVWSLMNEEEDLSFNNNYII